MRNVSHWHSVMWDHHGMIQAGLAGEQPRKVSLEAWPWGQPPAQLRFLSTFTTSHEDACCYN